VSPVLVVVVVIVVAYIMLMMLPQPAKRKMGGKREEKARENRWKGGTRFMLSTKNKSQRRSRICRL